MLLAWLFGRRQGLRAHTACSVEQNVAPERTMGPLAGPYRQGAPGPGPEDEAIGQGIYAFFIGMIEAAAKIAKKEADKVVPIKGRPPIQEKAYLEFMGYLSRRFAPTVPIIVELLNREERQEYEFIFRSAISGQMLSLKRIEILTLVAAELDYGFRKIISDALEDGVRRANLEGIALGLTTETA